jgi:adenosylcobinamide-GDP ribazoletransferase
VITALRHELRLLLVAVQYFTRLPTPQLQHFESAWLAQSVRYFPVAGLIVGLIGAAVLWLCAQILPMPIAALLALTATIAVTGAFHEDGLADTFDALVGHVPRERALEIMRDSRIGTYGAAALGIALLLRWQLLCLLPLPLALAALVCAHPAARATAASLMATLAYVRIDSDAKAKPVAQHLRIGNLLMTLLFGFAPTAALSAYFGMSAHAQPFTLALLAGAMALVLVRAFCARWFRRRLGGYTGDGLGCCEQLGEIAFGLACLAVFTTLS